MDRDVESWIFRAADVLTRVSVAVRYKQGRGPRQRQNRQNDQRVPTVEIDESTINWSENVKRCTACLALYNTWRNVTQNTDIFDVFPFTIGAPGRLRHVGSLQSKNSDRASEVPSQTMKLIFLNVFFLRKTRFVRSFPKRVSCPSAPFDCLKIKICILHVIQLPL